MNVLGYGTTTKIKLTLLLLAVVSVTVGSIAYFYLGIDPIMQWFSGISQMAFGFLLGSIITGVFTWTVVMPKIMKNKDVQDLKEVFKEAVKLFKEAIPMLEKILENQEKNNHQ